MPMGPQDWFDGLATFSAGMGDAVSGGLTKRIRERLGYDDAVKYGTIHYGAGQVTGTVVVALSAVANPCGAAAGAANAVRAFRGLSAARSLGNAWDAADALRAGDMDGYLDSLNAAKGDLASAFRPCFAAGTPVSTPAGMVPIEGLREGDLVFSRDEHDPPAPVEAKAVRDVMARVAPVLQLRVGGKVLKVTAEHPFYCEGREWVPAGMLKAGERLLTRRGGWLVIEGVVDELEVVTVYNVEVADWHTYFVGDDAWWEFELWTHNHTPGKIYIQSQSAAGRLPQLKGMSEQQVRRILNQRGFRLAHVSKSAARNETWRHADGSEIRIHPYGNANLSVWRSANNAHVHKEDPLKNQLTDRGFITDPPLGVSAETHIGIRNPPNLPQIRNRPHGAGNQ